MLQTMANTSEIDFGCWLVGWPCFHTLMSAEEAGKRLWWWLWAIIHEMLKVLLRCVDDKETGHIQIEEGVRRMKKAGGRVAEGENPDDAAFDNYRGDAIAVVASVLAEKL